MKVLKERTEIAKAINFGKYPVIPFDLSKKDEYGYVGVKVKIKNDRTHNPRKARLRTYGGDSVVQNLEFSCSGISLTDSFTYGDFTEMVEYANAPTVEVDQDIVIAFFDSEKKKAYPPIILHTGDSVDPFCITPLKIEEFNVTIFKYAD